MATSIESNRVANDLNGLSITQSQTNGLEGQISCDVAVVGYGPVGQTVAALLAQQGLKVVSIEKHANRYHLSRAGHFDGEIMRIWQRLGCTTELELASQVVNQMSIVDADLQILQTVQTGHSNSGWRQGYLCPSTQIEDIVSAKTEKLGVQVLMGMTATEYKEHDGYIVLRIQPSKEDNAPEKTVNAKYVIGADGANSFMRSAIGASRQDLGFAAVDNLVIDFKHSNPDRDFPNLAGVYQILDPRRPQHAGRWGGSSWSRFEYMRMPHETREEFQSDEHCWKLLSKWGLGPKDGHMERRAIYTFEASMTDKWRSGRAILMGDSAHTMPPYMGQGMCSGLRDAFNLSWKLAAVISGDASEQLLDSYQLEREAHVTTLIQMSMGIGRLVLVTDPEQAQKRNEMIKSGNRPPPPAQPKLVHGIVATADSSPAIQIIGRPSLQGRAALRGKIGLLDDFLQPGWKLITRHDLDMNTLTDRQKDLVSRVKLQVAHVSRGAQPGSDSFKDLDGDYDTWYMQNGLKAFLQRPDNYVFSVARTMEEIPLLLDDLGTQLVANGFKNLGY